MRDGVKAREGGQGGRDQTRKGQKESYPGSSERTLRNDFFTFKIGILIPAYPNILWERSRNRMAVTVL